MNERNSYDKRASGVEVEIKLLGERLSSLERRMDENTRMMQEWNELNGKVNLMLQKLDLERTMVNERVEHIESSHKARGERLGEVEKALVSFANLLESVDKIESELKALSAKPGKNWDKFIWLIVGFAVSAIGAVVIQAVLK